MIIDEIITNTNRNNTSMRLFPVVYGEILEIGTTKKNTVTSLPCLLGSNEQITSNEENLLSSTLNITAYQKIKLNSCSCM